MFRLGPLGSGSDCPERSKHTMPYLVGAIAAGAEGAAIGAEIISLLVATAATAAYSNYQTHRANVKPCVGGRDVFNEDSVDKQ
jgi:hypothetical protein